MRWFEQVRWVIRADEPGELEPEVELEEVPVELPVGAGILLFEALLVVDLWGDDQEQADQERDQQPGQPFPDEAGRGPRAQRVPGAQAGHHEQQRHSPQPGEQHEQRQRQVGRLVLHKSSGSKMRAVWKKMSPPTTAARIRSRSCRRGLPVVVMAEPTVEA